MCALCYSAGCVGCLLGREDIQLTAAACFSLSAECSVCSFGVHIFLVFCVMGGFAWCPILDCSDLLTQKTCFSGVSGLVA